MHKSLVQITMTSLFILCTLLAAQIHSSEAFTTTSLPSGGRAVRSKTNARSIIGISSTVFAAASDNEAADGSPDKIPPQSSAEALEFTTDEIQEMEKLILELSKEQNDELRRQKLADILDKELVPPISSTNNSTTEDNSNNSSEELTLPQEIPRFARLFQYSLDTIGETVQTAAREKAMELTENSLHVIEDSTGQFVEGTGPDRIKSEEEMQLWALIDMMVQSKTRVKLYMGSLGSKGAFR